MLMQVFSVDFFGCIKKKLGSYIGAYTQVMYIRVNNNNNNSTLLQTR